MPLFAVLLVCLSPLGLYLLAPDHLLDLLVELRRRNAGVSPKQVEVENYIYHYLESEPTGDIPFVFVHGVGSNKDSFIQVARHMKDRHVVLVDLLGHGDSDAPLDGDYRIDAQSQRLHVFIKALGFDKVHLVGHSMGGWVAARYARDFADSLASLVLVAAAGVASAQDGLVYRRIAAGERNPLTWTTIAEGKESLTYLMENPPRVPKRLLEVSLRRSIETADFYSMVHKQYRGPSAPVAEEDLAGSDVASLILWGRNDKVLHVSGAEILAEVMNNAAVEILEMTGHAPTVEAPEVLAESITRFVDEL